MKVRVATAGLVWTLLAAATPAPPAERLIDIGAAVVDGRINGTPGRILIDPSGAGMPLIRTSWAQQAGLKAGMFGFAYAVGPERVTGRTAVGRIDVASGENRRRIGWTDRPFSAGADGVIGPGGLPEPIVHFRLRPSLAGERTVTLPQADGGGLMSGWGGVYARIDVGGDILRIRFDPHHRRSLATAGAAARLAATLGGQLLGEPVAEEIAFGIRRPVRTMTLATPLRIGQLALAKLGVRTSDFGTTGAIPEAGAPAPDPDEIVVTGKGKKSDPNRDRLSIGADDLARCSSIVFDAPAKVIRLTCA